ncbi:hypothetical protein B0H13DRAFT_2380015 [Mycena leptocephala]|nr:hypothetical protein B0H13DRAFT_2380015 [Mycena leptocephala]
MTIRKYSKRNGPASINRIARSTNPRRPAQSTCFRSPARPIRAVRLAKYDLLNRFVGAADLKGAPELFMGSPLPDNLAMCEIYVSSLEGFRGPTQRLSLAAYHPRVGETVDMHLARFNGTPDDAGAPLWVRRVPPGKLLRWSQPLEFVGKVVGGLTDIPVQPMTPGDTEAQDRMARWSRNVLAITASNAAREQVPSRRPSRRAPGIRGGNLRLL